MLPDHYRRILKWVLIQLILKSWWFRDFNTFAFITVLICNSVGLNNFDNLFFSIIFRILIMQTRPQLSKCMTCCITNLQPLYTEPSFLPNLQARLLWVVFCLLYHKTGFFPNIQSTAKSLNSVHSLLGIPITSPVSDDSFAKESHQLPVNVVYILYRIWNHE